VTLTSARSTGPLATPLRARRRPLDADAASFTTGLHASWLRRNVDASLPHGIAMLETAGNLDNLRRLAGESDAPFRGQLFADSDVYKTLEAIAWQVGDAEAQHPELMRFYRDTVGLLERAQRDDGYLDSAYQLGEGDAGPWTNFTHGHELYCLGHLLQAGIAGYRALGDDRLLGVGIRFVDLVIDLYGGPESDVYCGHPEIETALVELYRTTGDERHLDLAEAFIRRRGSGFIGEGVYGAQYYQDDVSVLDTDIMRGHAVRALYLNAGVTDLYLERGDEALLDAMKTQWDDLVGKRLYLTGGTGSRHRDESFGDAYELPSERAYAETCAGIALINWAWRLHVATGESRYLDAAENALYNVVSAGISVDGLSYFYSNPLQRRPDHGASQEESSGRRLAWYSCACCPPNLMRTFASLQNLLATSGGDTVQVANYAASSIRLPRIDATGATSTGESADAAAAVLHVDTDYPASGSVTLRFDDAWAGTLELRVPEWSRTGGRRARLTIDGEPRDSASANAPVDSGWLRVEGPFAADTVIRLELDVSPSLVFPHPRIDGLRGSVAVRRGPLVYCVDQTDNAVDIETVDVATDASVVEVSGSEIVGGFGPFLGIDALRTLPDPAAVSLYSSNPEPAATASPEVAASGESRSSGSILTAHAEKARLILRPYALWGNGPAPAAMRVWMPRASAPAHPTPTQITPTDRTTA